MIVTFCGHSDHWGTNEEEKKILALLSELVGDRPADLYLGNYGQFDYFAYRCSKKYQMTHPNVRLIFITPYINQSDRLKEAEKEFDGIIYPPIEHVPPRFAILHRNKWMVEQADCVIACISWNCGGAYQTYHHAKVKQKPIYNITGKEFL